MRSTALCSAQTTVSPLKMLIFTSEGIVCSGEFRIHNPKVGGSIPPPATNKINNLRRFYSRTWSFQPQVRLLNNVCQGISGTNNYNNFTANQLRVKTGEHYAQNYGSVLVSIEGSGCDINGHLYTQRGWTAAIVYRSQSCSDQALTRC